MPARNWASRCAASLVTVALGCGIAGCGAPTAPSDTALIGTVVRGPTQPVCRVGVPCDAPFSASFTVQRGGRMVAAFNSDSEGRFEVPLAPGIYVVIPGSDAPIMSPRTQSKEVTVGAGGKTTVLLQFDTGIR